MIQRILTDPDFIYRAEIEPAKVAAGTPYQISDLELASRLSFFLWSSIPDTGADQSRLLANKPVSSRKYSNSRSIA